MQGYVKTIYAERGFGFVRAEDGSEHFFHCKDLSQSLDFDELLIERRVVFEIGTDQRSGRDRAFNVRPAS